MRDLSTSHSRPLVIGGFDYPAGLTEDLVTLEREGAMFADQGGEKADGTATFSYYRIKLPPDETFQYVETSLAFVEFHDAVRRGANIRRPLSRSATPK